MPCDIMQVSIRFVISAELLGIRLRHQARFMSAVACAQVPKLTVIVGNSFGCDNYMMVNIQSTSALTKLLDNR